MKHKYLYLFLIILFVGTLTINTYRENQMIEEYWETKTQKQDLDVCPGYTVGKTISNFNLYLIDNEKENFYDLIKDYNQIYLNINILEDSNLELLEQIINKSNENSTKERIVIPIIIFQDLDNINQDQIKDFLAKNKLIDKVYFDSANIIKKNFKIKDNTLIYINNIGTIEFIALQEIFINEKNL